MKSAMKRTLLILTVVLAMIPATSVADALTVLVGAQSVSFGADLGEYYDITPGPGATVLVGLNLGIPVDIRVGRRTAREKKSGREATYDWAEFGPRFRLCQKGSPVCGDWFVGVGAYDLKFDDFEFDTGAGGFIGMGVQETVSDKYVGRFEVKGVYWVSDTFNTDAASLNISLLVGFEF